jgi:hypothetical protein
MERKVVLAPEHTAPCGRVTILGITSGEIAEIEFAGSPSVDAAKLARFAVGVGFRVHRKLLRDCPALRWFVSGVETSAVRCGFADPFGGYVALGDHLSGRDLVEVCLHELRHCAQRGVKLTDCEAEHDAEGFAHRWTPPTLRAFRETDGALSRVAVSQWARPGGRALHMDIRLTRPTAKVWQYNARATGDSWRELPNEA